MYQGLYILLNHVLNSQQLGTEAACVRTQCDEAEVGAVQPYPVVAREPAAVWE